MYTLRGLIRIYMGSLKKKSYWARRQPSVYITNNPQTPIILPQWDHAIAPAPVLKFLDPPLIVLFGTHLIPFMVQLSHFYMWYYANGCFIFRGKHFRAGITVLMKASSLFRVLHVPVVLPVLGV